MVVRLLIRRPECLGPALRGGSKSSKRAGGTPGHEDGGTVGGDLPGAPQSAVTTSGAGSAGDGLEGSGVGGGSPADSSYSAVGGGLLKAIREGLVMSAQTKLVKMAQEAEANGLQSEDEDLGWRTVLMDYEDANLFTPLPYNFHALPVNFFCVD
ncbi:unnamed protein product [Protopolystoma xenopodis]|uniref:Uncharacterized protein n=1 Tax=Protopolystoma xenopodis TaxID=117903 RepID=A0A3S5ALD7_9PLAT|nr:unnamed protein product [Protopolystoma xenopodis]